MGMDDRTKARIAHEIVDNFLSEGVELPEVHDHQDMEYATEFELRDVWGLVHDTLGELRGLQPVKWINS